MEDYGHVPQNGGFCGRVAFWLKMTLKTPTSTTPPPLCYPHPTSWLCAVLILKLWRFTLFAHKSNKLLTAARASQGNIRGSAFTAIIRYMSLIIEINSRKIIPMYAGCYVNDAAVEIIILVWWWEPPPLHWGQTYMRPSISANQFKWVDKEFEIWNPLLRRDQCLIGKKLTNSNELNRERLNRREKTIVILVMFDGVRFNQFRNLNNGICRKLGQLFANFKNILLSLISFIIAFHKGKVLCWRNLEFLLERPPSLKKSI